MISLNHQRLVDLAQGMVNPVVTVVVSSYSLSTKYQPVSIVITGQFEFDKVVVVDDTSKNYKDRAQAIVVELSDVITILIILALLYILARLVKLAMVMWFICRSVFFPKSKKMTVQKKKPNNSKPVAVNTGAMPAMNTGTMPTVNTGAMPTAMYYGNMPPAVNYGNVPPAVNYGNMPTAVNYGNMPPAMNYGNVNYGGMPTTVNNNNMPTK